MTYEALLESIQDLAVSPFDEAVAFETLYMQEGMTLKRLTEATVRSGRLPSEALAAGYGLDAKDDPYNLVPELLPRTVEGGVSIAVRSTPSWPAGIDDSARPSPLVYWRGDVSLTEAPSVSIVGSRKASAEGLRRAMQLGRDLARADVAVATGMARGVDTSAAEAALAAGGYVVGVLGTPVDEHYPKEGAALQERVARDGLLVSQVPFCRYARQPFETKRWYFPERNELMAAVSRATVIVEASDTSGTLTQARACLHQGRPLFILRSCADNPAVSWPSRFIGRPGVQVLDQLDQLLEAVV